MLKTKLMNTETDLKRVFTLSSNSRDLENEVKRLKGIIQFFEINYKNQFDSYQNTLEDMTLENYNLSNKLGNQCLLIGFGWIMSFVGILRKVILEYSFVKILSL